MLTDMIVINDVKKKLKNDFIDSKILLGHLFQYAMQ